MQGRKRKQEGGEGGGGRGELDRRVEAVEGALGRVLERVKEQGRAMERYREENQAMRLEVEVLRGQMMMVGAREEARGGGEVKKGVEGARKRRAPLGVRAAHNLLL